MMDLDRYLQVSDCLRKAILDLTPQLASRVIGLSVEDEVSPPATEVEASRVIADMLADQFDIPDDDERYPPRTNH